VFNIAVPETLHLGASCQHVAERAGGLDMAVLEHDDTIGAAVVPGFTLAVRAVFTRRRSAT